MKSISKFALAASIVLATIFTLSCSSDDKDDGGGGEVSYGGKKYNTVKIGSQVWFAENLNYAGDGNSIGKCYSNLESNCAIYGRLYTWSEATAVCPNGYHLPSREEWTSLMNSVGTGGRDVATKLKAESGWNTSYGNGTNDYGFSALPGGYGNSNGNFSSVGNGGFWWTTSENSSGEAYVRDIYDTYGGDFYSKSYLCSVRCVKD